MGEAEYKENIIEIIKSIDDKNVLAYLYYFIKGKTKGDFDAIQKNTRFARGQGFNAEANGKGVKLLTTGI